jgi:hypothetical protein
MRFAEEHNMLKSESKDVHWLFTIIVFFICVMKKLKLEDALQAWHSQPASHYLYVSCNDNAEGRYDSVTNARINACASPCHHGPRSGHAYCVVDTVEL